MLHISSAQTHEGAIEDLAMRSACLGTRKCSYMLSVTTSIVLGSLSARLLYQILFNYRVYTLTYSGAD